MTGLLASVRNAAEAELAVAAGVDLIDLKDPGAGALGALAQEEARKVLDTVGGRVPVSAVTGDLACEAALLEAAIRRTAQPGVYLVKAGVFAERVDAAVLAMLARLAGDGVRIVLVFFAERWTGRQAFPVLHDAGVAGVMLDTSDKAGGSLTAKLELQTLERFVAQAAAAGLMTGLAGSLTAADVPVLAGLRPDYLGFRGALCRRGDRGGELDREALLAIRALLPRPATSRILNGSLSRRSHGAMAQQGQG